MSISNREEKGLGTNPDTSPGESCEICQKLPAYRHYNHYFVCTPCFIDLLEEEKKSQTGGKPYVQLHDRWKINQPKEERVIGVSKIHHIKPSHPGIPSSYIISFKEYECGEEEAVNIYPKVAIVEGNPYYEETKGYSAASRTYYKVKNFVERSIVKNGEKGVNLCKLVLTFPKELSEHYYKKGGDERAWELFKKFWERLHEEFCISDEDRKIREKMGAVVNLHTWKTRKPMNPHYHFHASFLNIVSRASIFEGNFDNNARRFSPIIERSVLEWLKEKWRMLLEEEGKSLFGRDYELKSTNIYYKFVMIENKKKVLHSLKYQYRQWVVDFCDWSEENGYKGGIPRRMVEYRNRARVYGFWKKIGADKEMKEELEEEMSGKKKICPFCGSITKKSGEESPEEIWKKEKNGELEWYEFSKGGLEKARHPCERFFSYISLPSGMCKAPSILRE